MGEAYLVERVGAGGHKVAFGSFTPSYYTSLPQTISGLPFSPKYVTAWVTGEFNADLVSGKSYLCEISGNEAGGFWTQTSRSSYLIVRAWHGGTNYKITFSSDGFEILTGTVNDNYRILPNTFYYIALDYDPTE